MTDNAWFGVTHESVADKVAEHMAAAKPLDRSIILDAMCGVGGNAIAFAKSGRWKRVYAIEKDPATLACARHNAEIYGVVDKITFFEGDCFELLGVDGKKENAVQVLKSVIERFGVIFASPPWGGKHIQGDTQQVVATKKCTGPAYTEDKVFDLALIQPYSLNHLYEKLAEVTPHMALYLPRNSDLAQIGDCVEEGKKAQVVHYCTNGTSRALCVYLGDWSTVP